MANTITVVRLLSVPLENDYLHTLYFESKSAQTTYFASKIKKQSDYFSYQRKDKIIRYPAHIDTLLSCNYVMYKNSAYSDKWFYAFITDMEYANDECTNISIETDVIQTWLFDYEVQPSFVEREHVASDDIGEHTFPEQIEHGEYICNKHTKAGYSSANNLVIVVGATKTPDGENVSGSMYDNLYTGVQYFTFPHTLDGVKALKTWLAGYADDGAIEAIQCMFLAPDKLAIVRDDHTIAESAGQVDNHYINADGDASSVNTLLTLSTNKLNGYTPRNKKLLSYPYRYLLASNNAGAGVPYHYEHFKDEKPRFYIDGCLCPSCSVRLIPRDYKGVDRNDEEGLNLGKFPILNWTSDVYTNWLTQNGVNIALNVAGSALTIAGGIGLIATGAGAGAGAMTIASGVLGISNAVGEVYTHSMTPPQSQGNLNSGDVTTASGNNDFHFYDMSIKLEYAVKLDEFFDCYGYKVNRVKTPEKNHRTNYWYTKTIDVSIDGAIPPKDLNKIKECYNKGITFWKDPDLMGVYGVTNTIV